MGIWEMVASKAEAVKRNAPDATPVKNACRNSYNSGSAALAKIDRTVRTIALGRAAQPTPANDNILAKEVETDRGVIDAKSMKNGCKSSCDYGYGFTTFAKIGYTVRVKCVYRIVNMMKKDGSNKSITTGFYATSFSQNIELHESEVGDDIIPGQAFAMPLKKECMNNYTFGFITFAKIGYVVRVNVYRFGQWMGDDDTKSKMTLYSEIFAGNVLRYVLLDCYKLIPGGFGLRLVFVLLITIKDIMDEYQTLSKEKAGDGKDEVRFSKLKEFLSFWVVDIITVVTREPFRTQFLIKGVFTAKSFAFFVSELLESTTKRHFGTQDLCQIEETILRPLFRSTRFANNFEIPEATWVKSLSLIVRGLFVLKMKQNFGDNFWSKPEEIVVATVRALSGTTCWTNDLKIHEPTTKKREKKKGKLNSLE